MQTLSQEENRLSSMKKGQLNKGRVLGLMLSLARLLIIFGLGFIILKPLIYKVLMAFMSTEDLINPAVNLIPTKFSVKFWTMALEQMKLPESFFYTFTLAVTVGVLQVISCTMVGYGLGRFKFFGRNVAFVFVILIMLMPYSVISTAQYLRFVFFGFGSFTVNLMDTYWPVVILAFTGTNIKNGLYIYLMREFFRTMPGNLEEAAYIDGCGPIHTFIRVIVPNARGMMTTVFLFSFCWQWTEGTYARRYFSGIPLLGNIFSEIVGATKLETSIVTNAAAVLASIPLIILFLVFQKTLVKSITLSGMAN